MNINQHRLQDVRFLASPNFNQRPDVSDISLIVIHGISLPPNEFNNKAIADFFTNQLAVERHPYFQTIAELRVSSHVVIFRDGALTQFVDFDQRAWHAGQSSYAGRENCNDYSIGIELEGSDTIPYTAEQYECLGRLVASLLQYYPTLSPQRIVGHSDIAPGRKTDPGPSFVWSRFRRELARWHHLT